MKNEFDNEFNTEFNNEFHNEDNNEFNNEIRNEDNNEFNNEYNNGNTNDNTNEYSENKYYQSNEYLGLSEQYNQMYDQKENTVEIYPNVNEKKPRKGRGIISVAKLTAAAIAFGMIAGASFQGYSYLTNRQDTINEKAVEKAEDKANEIQTLDGLLSDAKGEDGKTAVTVDSVKDNIISDVSGVVESVMPAIVAINSSATVTDSDMFGREFNQEVAGSGSGIIVGQIGSEILIVTNNHVVNGAQNVEIVFSDETKATATIKGTESNSDLAVVSVPLDQLSEETASSIKIATLGSSDDLKAGQMSIAIGNALGYGQSVTVGYISALDREVTIDNVTMNLLQTDAAINPGNSGGALLNAQGEVIGINSVKYASAEVEGMGYAIPISEAIPIINELMNRETLTASEQGFLGINISTAQNVTQAHSERFQMPIGVYVNDVVEESPVANAGLQKGSIIVGIDDKTVETIDDLISILSYSKAGEKVTLVINVSENGAYVEKELTVTLGNKPQ